LGGRENFIGKLLIKALIQKAWLGKNEEMQKNLQRERDVVIREGEEGHTSSTLERSPEAV
jgi:hypothetical protein